MTTQSQTPFIRRVTSWLGYNFDHHFIGFFFLTIVLLFINELYVFGLDVPNWDSLFITGVITLVISIRLARKIPEKANETIHRLANRSSLEIEAGRLATLKQHLEARTQNWMRWSGLIVGAVVLIAFFMVFRFQTQVPFTLEATLAGYVAGRYLGRAASYGRLAQFLSDEQVSLKVQPGHLDGVAGLKPIGDFYFYQAMLIAIPALFLAVWWVLIPFFPYYRSWRIPYASLLAIALLFEILSFLLPLWSFHQDMQKQKAKLLEEADGFSHHIMELQTQLIQAQTDQERSSLQEQLSLLTDRYWVIEQMPTWPIGIKVRRQFTLGNMALFLPLVGQLLSTSLTEPQKTLWEKIQEILTKLLQS